MLIIKCTGKNIEAVLKNYRQKVDKTRQLVEIRSRKEFEKASSKKRKLKQRAQYNNKKANVEF